MTRKLTYLVTICIFLITVLTFSSCKKDDIDTRDGYVGTYSGVEKFTNDGTEYTSDLTMIVVSKSSVSDTKILLSGDFLTVSQIVDVTINNDGTFNFIFTVQLDGQTKTITGSGKITDSTLSYSYTTSGYVTISYSGTKR